MRPNASQSAVLLVAAAVVCCLACDNRDTGRSQPTVLRAVTGWDPNDRIERPSPGTILTLAEIASEYERMSSRDAARRDLFVRAFDAGYLICGAPYENARRLFGHTMSEMVSDLPDVEQPYCCVSFLSIVPAGVSSTGEVGTAASRGWEGYIYHKNGQILGVMIKNTHKMISPEPREHDTATFETLAECYRLAASATIRRELCLRAIDAGYIRTGNPLETVRSLCGPDFREAIGKDEYGEEYGVVRFGRDWDRTADDGCRELLLIVLYDHAKIDDCYLAAGAGAPRRSRRSRQRGRAGSGAGPESRRSNLTRSNVSTAPRIDDGCPKQA